MSVDYVRLTHLGRALSVYPAHVGKQFETYCTVMASERIPPSIDNGWKAEYVQVSEGLFWYDTDKDGSEYFCTFSGYFTHIRNTLREQYGTVLEVLERKDSGLGEPDIGYLKQLNWREGQPQAMAAIMAQRGGLVECDVGFGKSHIISRLSKAYHGSKIIITVPIASVAREFYKKLQELSTDVGLVGDGKREMNRPVTVAVSQSLRYAPRDANILFADEAHKLLTPNFVTQLNRFSRAKFFAFTASPDGRHDNRDDYMEAIFGPVIYKATYQQTVESGSVVPLSVVAYRVPDGPDVSRIRDQVRRDRLGIWRNVDRNQVIVRAVHEQLSLHGQEAQILIYCDKVEHAFILQQMLPDFVVAHGPLDKKRRDKMLNEGVLREDQVVCDKKRLSQLKEDFSELRITKAICTSVWSTGVNFWDLEIFVRADAAASKIVSGQAPGRLSRLANKTRKVKGTLVDFTDEFCKTFNNRWKKRRAVYASKGWEIETRTT